ncbi:HAMP domain-containing sensor histidine kinase [Clostridium beijerinckii]|uniref:histidine kinase n=2 Tax=Clostridium beijerinckii TaxID=1520 RepID=A0A9Q5D270_CLOBE|nr:HAMP domain-containing sensor histidine kinase [Clostridium beijerinckii]AQS04149.1 sensor histidine kinase YycG [Clostridium beijerinckii]MBA2883964.1 signal transduction histidine kinase [Clostridium beijerinckii]MBA2899148.1 signal transduction histidine kinase [Clostridium beijerinckii]MBA2908550.1 signal transduction histidine kinase [Clostridium beijerinckii]MBA9016302.1 signal transduction histidine kinase [Clostridium beijerinckii]
MMLKSQSISKRFGALVIGLINKIGKNLYTYILFAIIISLISGILTWVILNISLSRWIFIINYKEYEGEIYNDITTTVESKNLTHYEALKTIDSDKYEGVHILFFVNGEEKIKDLGNKPMHTYPIEYSDASGEIVIQPVIEILRAKYCEPTMSLISAIVAMLTFFLLAKKHVRYIEEIDKSIDIIAGGKLTYKIPVRGNNELSRLAANINEMSGLLKERIDIEKKADIKQRQLITNISHDLRTPLTVLTGYLDILENHSYENQEEADDFIYCASKKCSQLQKIIEELFTYNKLINGDIPICIENVDIIKFIQKNISQQGIDINLESKERELLIPIDIKLMNRTLDNLFDNIRKYGIDGEQATIFINRINHKVIIIFENTTNQDLSDKVQNLFERMYVGDESRTDKSSGLGLSIVAENVSLMKGKTFARFEKPILQIIIEFNEI